MEPITIAILVILCLVAGAFIFAQYQKAQEKKEVTPIYTSLYDGWYPWWRGSYVPPVRHYRQPIYHRTTHRPTHHRR